MEQMLGPGEREKKVISRFDDQKEKLTSRENQYSRAQMSAHDDQQFRHAVLVVLRNQYLFSADLHQIIVEIV